MKLFYVQVRVRSLCLDFRCHFATNNKQTAVNWLSILWQSIGRYRRTLSLSLSLSAVEID